jgi:hypothetical protein
MKNKYPGIKQYIDGDEAYIDAPAGHVGDKLRYYVVFTTLDDRKLSKVEQMRLQSQLEGAMAWHHGSVESCKFTDDFTFTTLLIPTDIAPQTPIDAYLDIASAQDKILRYYFYLTNNKQNPETTDLSWYLKEAQEHNTTIWIEG